MCREIRYIYYCVVCFGVYRTAAAHMCLCCADASTHWLESPLYKARPRGFGGKLQMILLNIQKQMNEILCIGRKMKLKT